MFEALKFWWNPIKYYKNNQNMLRAWAIRVYKKDKNTCAKCKKVGVRKDGRWVGLKFHAHHIYPKFLYPRKVFKVNNGITLCEPCHEEWHRIYKMATAKKLRSWLLK